MNNQFLEDFWKIYFIRQIYLTCFSENGDLLSQWRAYADDGQGIAIGFNVERLGLRFGIPHTAISSKIGMGLHRVIYNPADHADIVELIIHEIKSSTDNTKCDPGILAGLVKGVAPLIKNPAFAEEQEWRLICLPLITAATMSYDDINVTGTPSTIGFAPKRDSISPFFKFEFPQDSGDVVDELILGPKNRTDLNDLRMFLDGTGYKNVNIKRSSASYR